MIVGVPLIAQLVVEKLSPEDRALMRTSLFLGLAIDPFLSTPGRGDYLIRNLVGIDYQAGILAVNALLLWGADEALPERSILLQRAIPGSELHMLQGCAHWPQVDRQDRTFEIVSAFLRS